MPQFALSELGEKGWKNALFAAGLPEHFLEQLEGYIPENAMANFVSETSRALGQDGLGLLWAPEITVQDYGVWGDYILSAHTLEIALRRGQQIMPFHSNTDTVSLEVQGPIARYRYFFGLQDHKAYPDIAYTALASMLSIFRHFLGAGWAPGRIQMNIPRPTVSNLVEETFGCPVQYQSKSLSIFFQSRELFKRNKAPDKVQKTTIQDIVRERANGPPKDLRTLVRGVLFHHVGTPKFCLETTARMLGRGPRKLQRDLEREGRTFRELANTVKADRAIELLGLSGQSVSTVALDLGYTSPTNFRRAFKKETGVAPRSYLRK